VGPRTLAWRRSISERDLIQLMSLPFAFVAITGAMAVGSVAQAGVAKVI